MLDEELKEHRRKLEAAINAALVSSPEISEVIREVRTQGYDVFLIIEATVGFNRTEGSDAAGHDALPPISMRLTTQDESFLRQLKIRPE